MVLNAFWPNFFGGGTKTHLEGVRSISTRLGPQVVWPANQGNAAAQVRSTPLPEQANTRAIKIFLL